MPTPSLLFRLFFSLLLVGTTANESAAQSVNFRKNPFFYSVTYVNQLKAVHLNADNRNDIVAFGENGIHILRSNNAGDYQVERYPNTLSNFDLGKFNNDNETDVAATGYDSLYVLINSGNGNFSGKKKAIAYTGPSVGYPIVADFNRDGKDDIAVSNPFVSDIKVFLQTNTASVFAAPAIYAIGQTNKLEHGDYNGDGFEDLVALSTDVSNFKILMNKGNGTFDTPRSYSTLQSPASAVSIDMDNNNDMDLIIGNSGGVSVSKISVYKNTSGIFSLSATYPINQEYLTNEFLAAGDVNGDKFMDIVYTDWNKGTFTILYNDGNANFKSPSTNTIGGQPSSVILNDFDNDGKKDLAFGNYSSIQIAYNRGNGLFDLSNFGAGYPTSIAQADFNNDGKPDIATTNYNDRSISVSLNNTRAQFGSKKDYIVGKQPYMVTAGSVTGDNEMDLITANTDEDSITILKGIGDGTFALQKKYAVGNAPIDIAITDFNGDQQMDIMVLSTPITLLLNTGNGFQSSSLTGYTNPKQLRAGDLNGDKLPDIIVATSEGRNNLYLELNNGDGTFGISRALTSQFDEVRAIAVSDFNEDGKPDIGYKASDFFYVLANNGSASFSVNVYQTGIYQGEHLVTGDFDGNGKQDVAISSVGSSTVSVLVKDDAGGYNEPILFKYPGGYLFSMVAANFDGDNKDDLALAGWPISYLSIWTSLPRLNVSTVDVTREYGVENPAFVPTVLGWPATYAHKIFYKCAATIKSSVGSYAINPVVSDSILNNFAVIKSTATLTITPVPLQIKVLDTLRLYGEQNPEFRAKLVGLRNNDNFPFTFYTEAESKTPPGEYPVAIFAEDNNNINYIVTTTAGKLTIVEKVPTPFPNPSDGLFYLYSRYALSYTLLDIRGSVIKKGVLAVGKNEIQINVPSGNYFILLENGGVMKVTIF